MSTKNNKAPLPTDLDLMLYADGELEGEELAAVEAWLARDRTARQKLRALGMASAMVRDEALAGAEKADAIADLVMAEIARAPLEVKEPEVEIAADSPKKVDVVKPAARRAANDNARGYYRVIAAVAVAAAAALLLWGRGGSQGGVTGPTAALTVPAPHDTVVKVDAPRTDGEAARGVEVAAVDFGARTGAVFYVPTGSAASDSTTAVVWLSDDSSGGNE